MLYVVKRSCFVVVYMHIYSVDNSDYMRNGDFLPTRLHAQQDAVNLICHSKTRANPENNVGLLSIAKLVHALIYSYILASGLCIPLKLMNLCQ